MEKVGLFIFLAIIYPQHFAEYAHFDQKIVSELPKKSSQKQISYHEIAIQRIGRSITSDTTEKTSSDLPVDTSSTPAVEYHYIHDRYKIRRDLELIARNEWKNQKIIAVVGAFYIIEKSFEQTDAWPYILQNQYGEFHTFHPKLRMRLNSEQERIQFEQQYKLHFIEEIKELNLSYYKTDHFTPEKVLQVAELAQAKPEIVKIFRR